MRGVVAAFLIGITWWRKRRIKPPPIMELVNFRVFNLALLAWLIYSIGHAIYGSCSGAATGTLSDWH